MSGVAVAKQLPKAPRAAPSEVDLTRARKNARLSEVYEEVADAVPSGRYFFTWKLQLQSRQNAIVQALQATPEFKNVSEKEIIRRVKKNLRDTKTHSRNNNLYGKDMLEMDEKAEADRRDYLGLKHTTANNCDEARKNQLDRVHAVCAKYAKAVPSARYYFTWSMQPKGAAA